MLKTTASPTAKIHLRLDTPARLRKLVLESSLSAANLQQYFRKFRKIRKIKLEQQSMFNQNMLEISQLFRKMEVQSFPELPHNKPKEKEKEQKSGKMPSELSELKEEIAWQKQPIQKDKLEQELADIKRKIDSLEF